MSKKYVSLSKLSTFLDNLKNLFATKTTVDNLSTEVAYIDVTDNESIEEIEGEIISNDELNSLLNALEAEVWVNYMTF